MPLHATAPVGLRSGRFSAGGARITRAGSGAPARRGGGPQSSRTRVRLFGQGPPACCLCRPSGRRPAPTSRVFCDIAAWFGRPTPSDGSRVRPRMASEGIGEETLSRRMAAAPDARDGVGNGGGGDKTRRPTDADAIERGQRWFSVIAPSNGREGVRHPLKRFRRQRVRSPGRALRSGMRSGYDMPSRSLDCVLSMPVRLFEVQARCSLPPS